jgi:excisionase family DNA binding protein
VTRPRLVATERLLTVRDLCDLLGVSDKTARALLREIPHLKVGREYRVLSSDLERWVAEKRAQTR